MNISSTGFNGLKTIDCKPIGDARGSFVKVFHAGVFRENGLNVDFKESYYSTSINGVIRGMHFQLPPADHHKLVYAVYGKILDVVLDLRKGEPTFGQCFGIELSSDNHRALYIPSGFAHGFTAISEKSILVYMTGTVYDPSKDMGILYNSFGYHWPQKKSVLSERDALFESFDNFDSPF